MMRVIVPVALAICVAACSSKDKPSKKESEPSTQREAGPQVSANEDAATGPREVRLPPAPPIPPPPLGLPELPTSPQNALTPEKVALGKLLFFDERLSSDGSMSCASCHQPEHGWSSDEPRSKTVAGTPNLRHTPTLVNIGYAREYFWDGRMQPLERTIDAHWRGQTGASPADAAARLQQSPRYRAHFARAFHAAPTPGYIAEALASFVRTIQSGNAPFDQYEVDGNRNTVTAAAIAGAKIFAQKGQCALCHPPPLYTDFSYHVPPAKSASEAEEAQPPDVGRARVTRNQLENGAFKTPTLRDVTRRTPYFHDGSAASLELAVKRCMTHGGASRADRTGPAGPVRLSDEEVDQLIAFLQSLSPEQKPYPRPTLPPLAKPLKSPAPPAAP